MSDRAMHGSKQVWPFVDKTITAYLQLRNKSIKKRSQPGQLE